MRKQVETLGCMCLPATVMLLEKVQDRGAPERQGCCRGAEGQGRACSPGLHLKLLFNAVLLLFKTNEFVS